MENLNLEKSEKFEKFRNQIILSLKKTELYQSNINSKIISMEGMTGKKTRHFYNNLCSMDDTRYLEIGSWKGSSLCSAMSNNEITCLAIDNWKFLGGPKSDFIHNFNEYKGSNNAYYIENDCWEVDISNILALSKFNIYMYDGNHDKNSHYKALQHYIKCLDDIFIYLVDDWNWEKVRKGTEDSIKDNKLNILYQKEIFTDHDPGIQKSTNDWHNGISIFILEKI